MLPSLAATICLMVVFLLSKSGGLPVEAFVLGSVGPAYISGPSRGVERHHLRSLRPPSSPTYSSALAKSYASLVSTTVSDQGTANRPALREKRSSRGISHDKGGLQLKRNRDQLGPKVLSQGSFDNSPSLPGDPEMPLDILPVGVSCKTLSHILKLKRMPLNYGKRNQRQLLKGQGNEILTKFEIWIQNIFILKHRVCNEDSRSPVDVDTRIMRKRNGNADFNQWPEEIKTYPRSGIQRQNDPQLLDVAASRYAMLEPEVVEAGGEVEDTLRSLEKTGDSDMPVVVHRMNLYLEHIIQVMLSLLSGDDPDSPLQSLGEVAQTVQINDLDIHDLISLSKLLFRASVELELEKKQSRLERMPLTFGKRSRPSGHGLSVSDYQ